MQNLTTPTRVLVMAAHGKTGRRVTARLEARGITVRRGSRTAAVPFSWQDDTTWLPALDGVDAVYIVYPPDLAMPAAPADIERFATLAVERGVKRLVLLSGRGEPTAERCERIVQQAGAAWTIVRCGWFNQNFDEGEFADMVRGGMITLPVADVPQPFVDADDIADVAAAALADPGHAGEVYDVTGPRTLTLSQAAALLSEAAEREVQFVPITAEQFADALAAEGVPGDYIDLLNYLMTEVLDGRNSSVGDGVQRALGRPPRDFADYAHRAAATGVWNTMVHA